MTTSTSIEVDQESLREALAFFTFVGGNIEDVVRIAINKAGPKVKTRASRLIRENINLTASYVNDKISFIRSSRANLVGIIRTPSRGILMSRFSTDPMISNPDRVTWLYPPPAPARGIRVKVDPNDSAKVFKGVKSAKAPETEGNPFYVILKNSRAVGIAKRIKGERKYYVFHGPSISQVFARVKDEMLPEASEIYTKETVDAARYLVTKMNLPPEI
jgi:hypothetical protein